MKIRFFEGKKYLFTLALYSSDAFMFLVSAYFASYIFGIYLVDSFLLRFFLFSLLILIINFSAYELYKDKRNTFDDNDFMHVLSSICITWLVMIALILLFDPGDLLAVRVGSVALAFSLVLISLSRFVLFKVLGFFRMKGHDRKRVLFFGKDSEELVQKIKENKSLGYEVVMVTDKLEVLKSMIPRVDVVFLTKEELSDELLDLIIRNERINWKIVSSVLNLVIEPVAFDEFRDYPIINISPSRIDSTYLFIKRAMDLVISGISLILLSPLFILVAIIIKTTMPGPVFFKQERLGKNLKPFMVYKFRTMVIDAEAKKSELKSEVKGLFKLKDDPRITRFGKLLRRTGIDELPQLINIFKGEMAIVGPRPHLQSELPNFKGWRRARFRVKPGLTGMWQVHGRHELNFDKAVLYDIYYTKHMSLLLDISIILKTVPAIIMNRGRF
ncbi:sugar transferase [Candidatus Woesearchaeota archaeon]|nr:sugar transferase [Candidatus Woesearchaeota archaeon]